MPANTVLLSNHTYTQGEENVQDRTRHSTAGAANLRSVLMNITKNAEIAEKKNSPKMFLAISDRFQDEIQGRGTQIEARDGKTKRRQWS
jgi:hypothetical protein